MKQQIDDYLATTLSRWVSAVCRRPRAVCTATLAVTVLLGVYAALNLGVNSDNVRLISDKLPSMIAHAEFSKHFPNLNDAMLIVIDAETAELAREATDALQQRLIEQKDFFNEVYLPGGGSFFERNGLLYRTPDELDYFADQMARIQPILGELERDGSIAHLAEIVQLGLESTREEDQDGQEWSMVLDRVGQATVIMYQEYPIAISWEELLLRGSSIDVARRRILVAHPVLDFSSVLAAGRTMEVIRETARELELVPERGVSVRITGNPALNYEELIGLAWDIGGAGVFCFAIVVVVVYFGLRSVRLVIAAIATLLTGLVWTAAFAAATIGQLNLVSLSFGILFIGLGIDFGLHLGMRYWQLLHGGSSHADAMRETASGVGGSLVLCTFTTAVGFFVFIPTDYRGIAELGLVTGVGMFIILALTLSFFPALLSSWLALDPQRVRAAKAPPNTSWWERIEQHPRAVRRVALAVLVVAIAAIIEPGTEFDANVVDMRDQSTESVQAFNDLLEDSTTSPWYLNLIAPDLETARAQARRVGELAMVEHAITIADYVPDDQEEKLEILADVAMLLESPAGLSPGSDRRTPPSTEEQLAALRELRDFLAAGWMEESNAPLSMNIRLLRSQLDALLERVDREGNAQEALATLEEVLLSSLPAQVERLREALHASEITMDDLPEQLRRRMLASDGTARVQVFPKETLDSHEAFERFVDAARSLDSTTSGVVVNLVDFGRSTLASFRQALVSAALVIVALLWLLWRRLSDTLLVMAPLLLATALTVACMSLLDISFNFANVLVLPLMFGVGVDSGIHLVHRSHLPLPPGESLMGTTTARAVFYSATTTLVSFGTLAFSSHRGMQSLGIMLTIAMAATVLSNLVVLPALIDLRGRARG